MTTSSKGVVCDVFILINSTNMNQADKDAVIILVLGTFSIKEKVPRCHLSHRYIGFFLISAWILLLAREPASEQAWS
jgi:hypothetical protein